MTLAKPPFARGAIKPTDDVRDMFDRIVPRYDLMNRLMTGGRDVAWRRLVVREALRGRDRGAARVLDVATGTGDLAIALRDAGAGSVVGVDFSAKMLREAKRKAHLAVDKGSEWHGRAFPSSPNPPLLARRERGEFAAGFCSSRTQFADSETGAQECTGLRLRVSWVEGDAMMLPFRDGEFDAITVGFGLRNMPSYPGALREMTRVLRPGGTLVSLETTPLTVRALKLAFDWYFSRVVPLLGGWLSGDRDAYAYLPASAAAFPDAETLGRMMVDAGLHRVRYLRLGAGTIALHVGIKPDLVRNSAGFR